MLGILFWICLVVIIYAYAGYPLVIYLFASAFDKQIEYHSTLPTVTILFPALNEEKVIAKKIENTLEIDYPRERLQILIVNDGSTDQTANIVKQYASKGIEIVDMRSRQGKLSALKHALPYVKNEIILFSDADNYYPPNVLHEIVRYFSNIKVGAVSGGRNVIGENALGNAEGLYWKYEEFIKKQESKLGQCVGVAGDLLAIRQNLYIPPPQDVINDDFYNVLSILSQGHYVIYAPEARSFHPVAGSEQQEMERRARMIAGRYQAIFRFWRALPWNSPLAVWQIVSHKYLRPLVPIFMISAFLASTLALFLPTGFDNPKWLFLVYPYNWIFFSPQVIFYFLAWVGIRRKFNGVIGKILYLPSFLVNSNIAALQGLYRFLTSTQTVLWRKVER